MGRPRIPQRKTQRIIFRVTPKEYEYISAVARRAGLSVHTLARHSTLSRTEHLVIKRTQATDPALINQLHRIGINLNQIARRVNQGGRISPVLRLLCSEIERIINKEIKD